MAYQIDQSNKIENTNKHTVLAISNHKEYAILITAKTKRKIQETFRKQGKPRLFVLKVFSAGIVILIQNSSLGPNEQIIIDKEYPGKEELLQKMIRNILLQVNKKSPEILFKQIGKKSNAHLIAHSTALGKRKAEKLITFDEIKKLILK